MTIAATYVSSLAGEYGAAGGPWDLPVDDLLAGVGSSGVDDSGSLDAVALDARVAALAGGLVASGIGVGDAVVWQLPNSIDALALQRACWRVGAIAAPVHHLAGAADIAHVRSVLNPALDLIGATELPTGPSVAMGTCAADPAAIAAVLFTAGSTGVPKAVLHTRRSLAYKAHSMVGVHELTDHDVVLMPAPLAHVSGMLNGVLVPGAARMRTVLMARWDPEDALALIEEHQVSFMVGPPTFFLKLMDAPGFDRDRVRSLRLISSGGAGVTPTFIERATTTMGALVKRSYGSTEAPTVATSLATDTPQRASHTDGRALGSAELRLDASGELQVRGPELFAGYLDASATAEVITDDAWYRTGDLATIDADGWLTIVGRVKDVIIRGGENISPAEIEAVLEAHPLVSQAVAVGYPDDVLGERVCAFVVANGPFDLETSRSWFSKRGIAKFKTPERIVCLDTLPLLPAGKPDRAALRALAAHPAK